MKNYLLTLCLILISRLLMAQSTIITPGSQGNIQIPRLSYDQIMAIPDPQAGMMAFDSTFKCLKYYNGNKWLCTSQTEGDGKLVGFAWQKKYPAIYSSDNITNIATDNDNNVYIAGYVRNAYSDIYVAKFSPNGTLIWEYKDTFYNGDGGVSLIVDEDHNVYATTRITYNAYSFIRIYKFQNNGTLAWTARTFSQAGTGWLQAPKGIFLDNNHNVYVTGQYSGTMTIDPLSVTASTNTECFVLKLSDSGSPLWLKSIAKGIGIAKVSANGEAYYAGYFSGNINIEGNNLTSAGDDDILVCKYNTSGSLVWYKQAGSNKQDRATDLAIGNTGEVYAIGSFSGAASFDGNIANSVDSTDFFAVRYNQDGVFAWVRNGGGAGADKGISIELSPANEPVILGLASGSSAEFYQGKTIYPSSGKNIFLAKYEPIYGYIKWVKAIDNADGFKINGLGDIYVWKNIGEYTTVTNPIISLGYNNSYTKYLGNGTLVYKQVNQGTVASLAFGSDNHLFFTGLFVDTVQIGSTKLVCSDTFGDIYVSHWVE
jgi:hypothetical protein